MIQSKLTSVPYIKAGVLLSHQYKYPDFIYIWGLQRGGGGGGMLLLCWSFLRLPVPGRLAKNVAVTFYLRWKCCSRFSIIFGDTQLGTNGRYSIQHISIGICLFLVRDRSPKKYRNRKCTKENDRKCLEIMQESLLFPCWNSQKGKINRCHLYYLKNGLSLSLFFPPFLAIVGTFLEDGSQFLGPCHLSGFEPWHLQYWCSALTNWASKPTGSWSLNWFVITVKFRK